MPSTLSVWKFDSATGADDAERVIKNLASEGLIVVSDAATVSWPVGAKRPKTRQLNATTAGGALGGSFWGFLFGLIFFMPLIGMAIGAASGAIAGSLTDVGIDDGFIRRIRDKVTPGTSALFALTSGAVVDRVADAFTGTNAELLETNLSREQEEILRGAFSE
jgi:uncharacterized membrane protein